MTFEMGDAAAASVVLLVLVAVIITLLRPRHGQGGSGGADRG